MLPIPNPHVRVVGRHACSLDVVCRTSVTLASWAGAMCILPIVFHGRDCPRASGCPPRMLALFRKHGGALATIATESGTWHGYFAEATRRWKLTRGRFGWRKSELAGARGVHASIDVGVPSVLFANDCTGTNGASRPRCQGRGASLMPIVATHTTVADAESSSRRQSHLLKSEV